MTNDSSKGCTLAFNQGQEFKSLLRLFFENVNYERQLNDGNCTGTIR